MIVEKITKLINDVRMRVYQNLELKETLVHWR